MNLKSKIKTKGTAVKQKIPVAAITAKTNKKTSIIPIQYI